MASLGRRPGAAPITSADIPDNSITAAKIVTDTIAAGDIGNDAVGTAELANDVVISTSGAITTTGAFTSIGIDDNANAVAITIDSDEKIGIGTTAPVGKLTFLSANSSVNNDIMFAHDSASARQHGICNQFNDGSAPSNKMVFRVWDGSSAQGSIMYLTGNGRCGIGTADPTYTLDVAGDIGINNKLYLNSTPTTYLALTNTEPPVTWETDFTAGWTYKWNIDSGASFMVFGWGGATGMHINCTTASPTSYPFQVAGGGSIRFTVWGDGQVDVNGSQVHAASDERLKQNITTITNGLDKINNMRGVKFQWKEEEDARYDAQVDKVTGESVPATAEYRRYHLGLIAQEVEDDNPELISNRGDGMKMIKDGNELDAILIEAVKELSAKVTALENA